jgi:hypothetical protein
MSASSYLWLLQPRRLRLPPKAARLGYETTATNLSLVAADTEIDPASAPQPLILMAKRRVPTRIRDDFERLGGRRHVDLPSSDKSSRYLAQSLKSEHLRSFR